MTRVESTDDEQLIRAVAAGEADALAVLYDRHAPWLFLRLSRRCPDRELVDEVVQDTFLTVWRAATRYQQRNAGGWLWVIASRRLIDALRAAPGRPPALAAAPSRMSSAEDDVLAGVEYGELAPALGRLSPELRAVLQATVIDGFTTREAATVLGIPEGTVKTRARRARAQLRAELA